MKKKIKGLYNKIEPSDIIAFTVVLGALILNWKGITTMYSAAVSIIIGYYFGRKLTQNGN